MCFTGIDRVPPLLMAPSFPTRKPFFPTTIFGMSSFTVTPITAHVMLPSEEITSFPKSSLSGYISFVLPGDNKNLSNHFSSARASIMSPQNNFPSLMDWFYIAEKFKRDSEDVLSPAGYQELEGMETRPNSFLPENLNIGTMEIPGVYKVQDCYSGDSGLVYFMDGIQKTVLWQHYNYDGAMIPIYLHFSGAVIIKRVAPDRFVPFDAIYKNAILVPTFLYDQLNFSGIVDTDAKNYWDLNEIRNRAKVKSRALRQEIEQEIIHRFLDSSVSDSSILIKDGNIFGTIKSEQVAGLIKTHRTLYLQSVYPDIQQMVWNMPCFHRSMKFSIQFLENSSVLSHKVNSFYLRINKPTHPEMGLLRIEYNSPFSLIEEFPSWIIAESRVRSNCERWDRQIYPIQVCENYLKTQIPGSKHIEMTLKSM